MAELIVNTGAILQNYRRYADAGQVIPVLKGNGYGLGAQPLRDLLARQGVTLFACATPEEALALAQPETDLLLLCCVHELPLLRALLQRRVILSVESLAQAQAIDALHMDARVHLAVDSGFGRFGFLPEQTEEMKRVFALDNLRVQGIFSHFRGAAAAPEQFARFSRVLLELDGYPVGLRHIAATRTADVPQYRLDAVRIGSGLTGCCGGTPAAVLEAERPDTLRGACELLRNLDNYQRITEDAYGYGQQRLQETLGLDDEAIYELDGYMDFEKYGQDCMENDCVTKTEFGLLRRLDPPFPEQTQGQQMFQ